MDIEHLFEDVVESKEWSIQESCEMKMHKIHVYPAKFPSFLVSESLKYAEKKGIDVKTIGDIFCGCGTSALEAKRNGKDFWGCDINPVATLITKVKTSKYVLEKLEQYYEGIVQAFTIKSYVTPKKIFENERINYWFESSQVESLYRLQKVIRTIVPKGKYQDFFLVAFSNILKGASRWLTKSIKPTIDKNKRVKDVAKLFKIQFNMMCKASDEYNRLVVSAKKTKIVNDNFLDFKVEDSFLDLLITSPPYVTSYEYADLHQLSTLWLGYVDDYRILRKGTIGSVYNNSLSENDVNDELNSIGKDIYQKLVKAKKTKAKSVAKYFIDIKLSVEKAYRVINPGGLIVFVIGNTKYKGVYVDNAKYIVQCMQEFGFCGVEVFKRKISSKILSPYRDKDGKFSNDKRKRKVYSYEYVVVARK